MVWTGRPTDGDSPGEVTDGGFHDAVLDEIEARGLLAYGDRQSNSTGTTTITGVLRLDSKQLRAGRHYELGTSSLRLTGGVNDGVTATLRITTDGTTPTTSSTALLTGSAQCTSNAIFENVTLRGLYTPSADLLLSVLLCVARTTGSAGNASIGGDATYPIQLWIVDLGESVSDTGVDI